MILLATVSAVWTSIAGLYLRCTGSMWRAERRSFFVRSAAFLLTLAVSRAMVSSGPPLYAPCSRNELAVPVVRPRSVRRPELGVAERVYWSQATVVVRRIWLLVLLLVVACPGPIDVSAHSRPPSSSGRRVDGITQGLWLHRGFYPSHAIEIAPYFHYGLDIANARGTPIQRRAGAGEVVTLAGWDPWIRK